MGRCKNRSSVRMLIGNYLRPWLQFDRLAVADKFIEILDIDWNYASAIILTRDVPFTANEIQLFRNNDKRKIESKSMSIVLRGCVGFRWKLKKSRRGVKVLVETRDELHRTGKISERNKQSKFLLRLWQHWRGYSTPEIRPTDGVSKI